MFLCHRHDSERSGPSYRGGVPDWLPPLPFIPLYIPSKAAMRRSGVIRGLAGRSGQLSARPTLRLRASAVRHASSLPEVRSQFTVLHDCMYLKVSIMYPECTSSSGVTAQRAVY